MNYKPIIVTLLFGIFACLAADNEKSATKK
jgi:hypothetical protein